MSQQGKISTINSPNASYPITPYVVGPSGQAGYQTIQSALNAANAAGGGTVYVQPGIYTENLILYNAVDLWGVVGIADTANCKIIGIHTPPITGTVTIRNIFLQSATHIFSSNAAGTSAIILIDAAISVANGYTFNLPNWTSAGSFTGFDIGEIGSINDGWVNNTGGATVFMTNITMGAGLVNSMITSGSVEIYDCVVQCPVNFQTGSIGFVDGGTVFQAALTFSNNSSGALKNSTINSGIFAAITMSSSGNWQLANLVINSTNNPAIAGSGAGTLTLGNVTFQNNANIAGTITLVTSPASIFGEVRAGADSGGQAAFTSLTNSKSTTISTGIGSVKMSTVNAAPNAAWIKFYVGTTAYWVPAWTTNAP